MHKHYRKFMRHKSVIGLIAIVSTLIVVLASSLAWFVSTDTRENYFKTKFKFSVDLVDEFQSPQNFQPEQQVAKKVTAVNTGDRDAFVRIMVFPVIGQGPKALPLSDGVEVSYTNLNTTDWRDGEDGYYYYLGRLQPGEEAPTLLTGVSLNVTEDHKATYEGAFFDIIVKSEATATKTEAYRLSWWGSDKKPTHSRYQILDDGYQSLLEQGGGS